MKVRVLLALALLAGGCAGRGEGRDAGDRWALESATPLAAPVDCIPRARIRGETARDDRNIDFVLDDGRTLRNRLPMQCRGLWSARRFTHRTALDRLCSTDTIALIDEDGGAGAVCGLGMFQEIAVPRRPPALR
jgi:hypothetical protein